MSRSGSQEPFARVLRPGYDPNRVKREAAWWGGFHAGVSTGIVFGVIVVSVMGVWALSRDVIVMPSQDDAPCRVLECQEETEP